MYCELSFLKCWTMCKLSHAIFYAYYLSYPENWKLVNKCSFCICHAWLFDPCRAKGRYYPLKYISDSSKTTAGIDAKLSVSYLASIWRIPSKFQKNGHFEKRTFQWHHVLQCLEKWEIFDLCHRVSRVEMYRNIRVDPDKSIWKYDLRSGQMLWPGTMTQEGYAAYQPLHHERIETMTPCIRL